MYLEIKNLRKKYGEKVAVKDVCIKLEKGVYGLLGANGAGKSTLMRMISNIIESTDGDVLYNGENIKKLGNQYCKDIGYLPQDFGFYPDFTVNDFLMYISAIKGLDLRMSKKRVEEVIDIVSLREKKNKKIKTLSGGMKRRLGIAQSILNDPKILILDEPTAGLDPKERIRFRNFLSEISTDKIVILSTHIVSDIQSIANKILIMKDGKIIDNGTPKEIIEKIRECVWECKIPIKMVDSFQLKYTISNMKVEGDYASCRVVSLKKPIEDAVVQEPSLEDIYIYYFYEEDE